MGNRPNSFMLSLNTLVLCRNIDYSVGNIYTGQTRGGPYRAHQSPPFNDPQAHKPRPKAPEVATRPGQGKRVGDVLFAVLWPPRGVGKFDCAGPFYSSVPKHPIPYGGILEVAVPGRGKAGP